MVGGQATVYRLSNNVFWSFNRGTVEWPTPPRPVPVSHWRTCKVSTLYLENCANACCINVFFSDEPFISEPGYRRTVNPSTTCSWKSLTCMRSLNFVSWKLCECIETDRSRDCRLTVKHIYPWIREKERERETEREYLDHIIYNKMRIALRYVFTRQFSRVL